MHTGSKAVRFHDARHTHASIILKQGIHFKIVQERLGHSSIQITLDTYSNIAHGLQNAAVNRFDDAFQIQDNNVIEKSSLAKMLANNNFYLIV
ncbi:tyrosine-type recombinase/integrase [Chloroflexota bacterium]